MALSLRRLLCWICGVCTVVAFIYVSTGLLTSTPVLLPPARPALRNNRVTVPPDSQRLHGVLQGDGVETIDHSRSQLSFEQIQERVQDLRKNWIPPKSIPNHWPPYESYADLDYDPNAWEGFEVEDGYYTDHIAMKGRKTVSYKPYPEYNSPKWKGEWKGDYQSCEGPRGKLLNESEDGVIHGYRMELSDFPPPLVGDIKIVDNDFNLCFDRHDRLGPYGDGQSIRSESKLTADQLEWWKVRWGRLQDQCLMSNRHRYHPIARQSVKLISGKEVPGDSFESSPSYKTLMRSPKHHHRTAVLIRTWTKYAYTKNDLQSIRALIMELSLLSGGEYEVFLLVNVKSVNSEMWTNERIYQEMLEANVPKEFQDISILWDENLMREWYPQVGDWQVYWHQFMPLQWFSKMHPEFDFVWNWEVDARYIGNHYLFLEKAAQFAKQAPRKYLWERNSRFYIPSTHGTYDQWVKDTHEAVEEAVRSNEMNVVWGAQPYNEDEQHPTGSMPPRSIEKDNFEWGVGEEADLITLLPMWDPTHTEWSYRDKIFNYLPGIRPHFTPQDPLDENFHHPRFEKIPRRAFINTVARFSRRQLHAMHIENRAGRTMQAEMWPATIALQHGMKAVYVPHPVWADRRWPAWYADAVFNANGNETARWGARGDSVYNHDREHNFAGWTWYFDSKFPRKLYRRWLDWDGEQTEDEEPFCLPPMLLHPVKNVYQGAEFDQRPNGASV